MQLFSQSHLQLLKISNNYFTFLAEEMWFWWFCCYCFVVFFFSEAFFFFKSSNNNFYTFLVREKLIGFRCSFDQS